MNTAKSAIFLVFNLSVMMVVWCKYKYMMVVW